MTHIPGSVWVTGFMAPTSSSDKYCVTTQEYNRGSLRSVDNAAARLAITADRRVNGMVVIENDTLHWFQLQGGIADINWVDLGTWFGDIYAGYEKQEYWTTANTANPCFGILQWVPVSGAVNYMGYAEDPNVRSMLLYDYAPTVPGAAMGWDIFSGGSTPYSIGGGESLYRWFHIEGLGFFNTLGQSNLDDHVEFQIGYKNGGAVVADVDSYCCFVKKPGDNKLYAESSHGAPGGAHTTVDTGVTVDVDTIYALDIHMIRSGAGFAADFFVNDVNVASISTTMPTVVDSSQTFDCYIGYTNTHATNNLPVLFRLPWIIASKQI